METTILLLEDDAIILHTLAMGLQDAGYRTLEADTGETAMRICSEIRPDIALLDMRLPDMSGIDFSRWLTATLDVPFLFLSAYNDSKTVLAATELGAFGYLVKPLDVPQILPTLQTALQRAQEFQVLQRNEHNLRTAFKTNRTINLAIGMLMQIYGKEADEIFDVLRAYCRSNRKKMIEVAELIVEQRQEIDLRLYINSPLSNPSTHR